MKKRYKKIMAVLVFILMVLPSVCVIGQNCVAVYSDSAVNEVISDDIAFALRTKADNEPEGTYGSLTYEKYFDFIVILGCDKSAKGEIVIPSEIDGLPVTWIWKNAFKGCKALTSIKIPDSVTLIESKAFMNCTSLESVTLPNGISRIMDSSFYGCSALTSITIPDNVIYIHSNAFEACKNLESIVIPASVTSIAAHAFSDCSSLSSVTIPDSIKSIEEYTFSGCTGLTSIGIPESITKIGDNAFRGCTGLTSIAIPESVKNIGDYVFSDCTGLKSVTIPESFTSIEIGLFNGCSGLTSITLPESITSIGRESFSGCTGLISLQIPESCEYIRIGASAFEGSGLKNVVINCKSDVGSNAFARCGSLMTASFTDSHIESRAFINSPNLKELTFSGKTTLDTLSIYGCESLENINFNDCELESEYAFRKCPKLLSIDSVPAFDSKTCDFTPEKKDFIYEHFIGSDEVGFINQFVLAQVDKVVRENITDDMSDIEKVRALHDWVCANTQYTEGNTRDRENHNDASVFMSESTVCEGYTRACNLLYNAAGIETYYVLSDDHAWNIVKVGGQYFHVDSTWDDLDTISHDWFLKSDDEMREAGGSHAQWKLYNASMLHSFQGKVLPECKYRMGDTNADGSVNIADLVLLQKYLLGNSGLESDKSVLADVYSDGAVDGFDLVLLRENIINNMN